MLGSIGALLVLAQPGLAANVANGGTLPPRTSVLFDQDAEGVLYAKGIGYKMVFDEAGAQYIPAFGMRAPRNLPIRFLLGAPSQQPPRREGDRVTLDRGEFVEVYDLAPQQVEQSFVLKSRPAARDLVFRLGIQTEMPVEDTQDGVIFRAPGLGHVTYSDATVIDAANRRLDIESDLADGDVVFHIPATFLAAATYPVTIDPIIASGGIAGGLLADAFAPDVAFAIFAELFGVAYVDATSASDRDIIVVRHTTDFTQFTDVAVDISTTDTSEPCIAAGGNQFLVAWVANPDAVFGSSISGRTMTPGGTQQPAFTISNPGLFEDLSQPDLGGGGTSLAGSYAIVYRTSDSNGEIVSRAISTAAVVGAENVLDAGASTNENNPSISPLDADGDGYLVAWRSGTGGPGSVIQHRQVEEDGSLIVIGTQPGESSTVAAFDLGVPSVAGDGVEFMVTYSQDQAPGNSDVFGKRFSDTGGFLSNGAIRNLTAAEPGVNAANDQTEAVAGYDGVRFAYAYRDGANVFVASAAIPRNASQPAAFLEGHVTLAPSAGNETLPAIGSGYHAASDGLHLIAFQRNFLGLLSIDGSLYNAFGIGGIVSVNTACGSSVGSLKLLSNDGPPGASNPAAVGNANFSLDCQSSLSSVPGLLAQLFIGLPKTPVLLCSGQGLPCALGVSTLIALTLPSPNTTVVLPIPADPQLFGITVAIQAIATSPVIATFVPACGPPKFAQRVEVSNTLNITFQ